MILQDPRMANLFNEAMEYLPDAEYGAKTKIMVQALFELEQAFQTTALSVVAPEPKKPEKNQAR
jgi:hypothetical protein